jgi:hypothetical protein
MVAVNSKIYESFLSKQFLQNNLEDAPATHRLIVAHLMNGLRRNDADAHSNVRTKK